jgi:hypothetical protein
MLSAFAKISKSDLASFTSAHPSFCLRGTIRLPLDEFLRNLIFGYFFKCCQEILIVLASDQLEAQFLL